jgi:hypothetical protein
MKRHHQQALGLVLLLAIAIICLIGADRLIPEFDATASVAPNLVADLLVALLALALVYFIPPSQADERAPAVATPSITVEPLPVGPTGDPTQFVGNWKGLGWDVDVPQQGNCPGISYGAAKDDYQLKMELVREGSLIRGRAEVFSLRVRPGAPLTCQMTGWADHRGRLVLTFHEPDGNDVGGGVFFLKFNPTQLQGYFSTVRLTHPPASPEPRNDAAIAYFELAKK